MTIKKTVKKTTVSASEGSAAGGAAIADRLRLTPTEQPVDGAAVSKKAAMWAMIAGLVAFALTGILVYMLYQHWEFLMPA